MKSLVFAVCLLLIGGCAQFSSNSTPFDINGTWKGEVAGGMGGQPMSFTFNFKRDGNVLTGTVNGAPGQWIPINDGEIKGKNLSFNVTADMGQMKMLVEYEGKIKGEKIKLSFKSTMPGQKDRKASINNRYLQGDMKTGGGMGGGMGMGMGMGGPGGSSSQDFIIEKVSD